MVLDWWWELPLGKHAEGFSSFHSGVDGYAQEGERFVLIRGKRVNSYVRRNMALWINEQSVLCDVVTLFVVSF
jgi:hypothetical protein